MTENRNTPPETNLVGVTYTQVECDEMCEIAKRDGYEEAVQDIDQKTGGDGEYRYCLGMEDDIRHQPDAATMIQRIVDRFEVLNLLDEATKDGRDQPDDSPSPETNVAGGPCVTHEDICNTHEGGPCNCDWSAAEQMRMVAVPRDRLLKLLEYADREYVPNILFAEFRGYLGNPSPQTKMVGSMPSTPSPEEGR